MPLGNILSGADQQYVGLKDETGTWRILNTWHEDLKQLDADDDIPDTTNIINQPNCYYINNYSLIQNNYYILISIFGGIGAFFIGLHITDCLYKIQNRRRTNNILLASAVDN